MRLVLLALLFFLSCACQSADRLPRKPGPPTGGILRSRIGAEVRADDWQEAVLAGLVVDNRYRAAGRMLGYTREDTASIWIVPGWPGVATTFSDVIIFNPLYAEFRGFILTHEFVHWHSTGTVIHRNLPYTIQEGLCEWIAAELVTEERENRHEQFRHLLSRAPAEGRLARLIEYLDLPFHRWVDLPAEVRDDMCAMGLVLVDRIGIPALRAAAERGPVTAEMLLQMAEIEANGDGLLGHAP